MSLQTSSNFSYCVFFISATLRGKKAIIFLTSLVFFEITFNYDFRNSGDDHLQATTCRRNIIPSFRFSTKVNQNKKKKKL